jgi:tRNA dimethylallyltransferase
MSAPSVVVVAGPTASGKSRLAMEHAQRLGGELVNADSVQVYRGFDIGSAKPSREERAQVRHHLIDEREAHETWSAAEFVADADRAIAGISDRGRLPIVVGGTGLYLRSLLRGLVEAPAADPGLRASLGEELARVGIEALHARLAGLDPAYAASIHVRDRVRVIRGLEIVTLTGRRRSDLHAEHGLREDRYRAMLLVLDGDREALHARIDARARGMVEAGLLAEVEGLLAAGVSSDAQPMRAIGYRHALQRMSGELGEGWGELLARDTRHYARRQLTWFRAQPQVTWVPLDGGGEVALWAERIAAWRREPAM